MKDYLKKTIALPQDHGSWVFILSPLLIGIFAGRIFSYATFNLTLAVMAAFLLRQPASIAVKSYTGRRAGTDLHAARFWVLIYGAIVSLALFALILEGFGYILYLAVPGVLVFGWHLWLVSRRAERGRPGTEVIATGVLALAAPAAYWVGIGAYSPAGWWLWIMAWVQSAASIVYAFLRLEQRQQAEVPESSIRWSMGRRAFLYTSFNLTVSLALGWSNLIPQLVFIPYLLQWLETLWGIVHPAIGWKPTRIGIRQLIVSILWTVLFIAFWRAP